MSSGIFISLIYFLLTNDVFAQINIPRNNFQNLQLNGIKGGTNGCNCLNNPSGLQFGPNNGAINTGFRNGVQGPNFNNGLNNIGALNNYGLSNGILQSGGQINNAGTRFNDNGALGLNGVPNFSNNNLVGNNGNFYNGANSCRQGITNDLSKTQFLNAGVGNLQNYNLNNNALSNVYPRTSNVNQLSNNLVNGFGPNNFNSNSFGVQNRMNFGNSYLGNSPYRGGNALPSELSRLLSNNLSKLQSLSPLNINENTYSFPLNQGFVNPVIGNAQSLAGTNNLNCECTCKNTLGIS